VSDALPPLDDAVTAAVRAEKAALRTTLDATLPRKRPLERNLLVATWELKEFGSLTEKWDAGARDTPKREWRALWAIAEIVSRFDVVALQEVTGNLRARMKTLGPRWQFVTTDVTSGALVVPP